MDDKAIPNMKVGDKFHIIMLSNNGNKLLRTVIFNGINSNGKLRFKRKRKMIILTKRRFIELVEEAKPLWEKQMKANRDNQIRNSKNHLYTINEGKIVEVSEFTEVNDTIFKCLIHKKYGKTAIVSKDKNELYNGIDDSENRIPANDELIYKYIEDYEGEIKEKKQLEEEGRKQAEAWEKFDEGDCLEYFKEEAYSIIDTYDAYKHISTVEPFYNDYSDRDSYDYSGEVEKITRKDIIDNHKDVNKILDLEYIAIDENSSLDELFNNIYIDNWEASYISNYGKTWTNFTSLLIQNFEEWFSEKYISEADRENGNDEIKLEKMLDMRGLVSSINYKSYWDSLALHEF